MVVINWRFLGAIAEAAFGGEMKYIYAAALGMALSYPIIYLSSKFPRLNKFWLGLLLFCVNGFSTYLVSQAF